MSAPLQRAVLAYSSLPGSLGNLGDFGEARLKTGIKRWINDYKLLLGSVPSVRDPIDEEAEN